MRITSKGQVTIPQHFREKLGLLPHTEVDFVLEDGALRLVKAEREDREDRGDRLIRALKSLHMEMSTEELMALTRGYDEDDA